MGFAQRIFSFLLIAQLALADDDDQGYSLWNAACGAVLFVAAVGVAWWCVLSFYDPMPSYCSDDAVEVVNVPIIIERPVIIQRHVNR